LIVIGGMGQSDFDPGLGRETIQHFANNDGWFDDMSDGPVDAELTIDGAKQQVAGAWVVVGPPDFVPPIHSYRTMYDSLVDVVVREMDIPADDGLFAGPLAHIAAMNDDWKRNQTIKDFSPSFTRDIAPILSAIARLERVHQHQMGPRARFHGSIGALNFNALGGPGSLQANRDAVFERVRDPNTLPTQQIQPSQMPSAYGDYFEAANGRGDQNDPAYLHSVSKLQYALLRAWQKGDFVEDWEQVPASPPAITPVGLDRAALENMSGGAFYPGMEASWLFAKKGVWEKPFRLARNRTVGTIPVPGEGRRDVIVEAGAFSQQMALPWQADFLDCSAGSVDDQSVAGGQRRVGWWPMTRPDEVFPFDRPKDRRPWARVPAPQTPLGFREMQSHNEMVNLWSTLGFVVETTPDSAPKDLYEVEFNKAPAAVLVAAAAPKPAVGSQRAARTTKKRRT
jgi:L-lysine epsilon oxidase-like protein